MEINDIFIRYEELDSIIDYLVNDKFGLLAKYTPQRQKTFFANPNLKDYSMCAISFKIISDKIVARTMPFPTSLKLDGIIYECSSGSTLDVVEEYRKYALGAEMMTDTAPGFNSNFRLAAGISPKALPLYKKLKFSVFEFPRLLLVVNSRPLLKKMGIQWLSPIVNCVLKVGYFFLKKKKNNYSIRQISRVPEWVGVLATNDGHKYMENHNQEWFQWNLDYNFKDDKDDSQSLYTITDGAENLGFVMIKERWRETAGSLHNLILGSIVEWGTYDESRLSESDLIEIAIPLFSSKVDLIEFASDNIITIKNMKKRGFLSFGKAHVAFKDKKKIFSEAKEQKNWRLRLGYADVILT